MAGRPVGRVAGWVGGLPASLGRVTFAGAALLWPRRGAPGGGHFAEPNLEQRPCQSSCCSVKCMLRSVLLSYRRAYRLHLVCSCASLVVRYASKYSLAGVAERCHRGALWRWQQREAPVACSIQTHPRSAPGARRRRRRPELFAHVRLQLDGAAGVFSPLEQIR